MFTNFHPDLYKWSLMQHQKHPSLANALSVYLALAAMAEPMGYPKLAKLYHQRLGTFSCIESRAIDFDIRERFWALDALINKIVEGQVAFRAKIAAAGRARGTRLPERGQTAPPGPLIEGISAAT